MIRTAITLAVGAAVALAGTTTARAESKRKVAVLEYRGGSAALPNIGARVATILQSKTSLAVVDADAARAVFGSALDSDVAKCAGEAKCVAGLGRKLKVAEVLLIGVSEFGDVILTLQRIDSKSGKVRSRVAEALAPDQNPADDMLLEYLRRVLPRDDFVQWGTILINANVTGARVTVGGKPRGKTPVEPMRVRAPASYDIAVDKGGYTGFRATVQVPPDAEVLVRPRLTAESDAWYKKWWVVAIAGGVAVSAVTVAVIATRDSPDDADLVIPPF